MSRVQYPPNMRVIRVMCSGRVDPLLVLEAFRNGADGVAVLGCHPGDCHYQTGNYQAERKMALTRRVLERVGIEPDRLLLDWVSAAEGQRFGEVITAFVERIRDLGPLAAIPDAGDRAEIGERIVALDRIRWLVGKERELVEEGNVYHEVLDEEAFREVLWRNVVAEYHRERIRTVLGGGPMTVRSIAGVLGMDPGEVLRFVADMEGRGQIHMHGMDGDSPLYVLASGGGCRP